MALPASLSRLLPVRSLRSGPNPRGTKFDVADLVESLGRSPQLQNVVVRPVPGAEKEWEVVAGHRRIEAAKRLGWSHVEAKIVNVDDATAERLALEENLRRKALPDEASAVARLIELYGPPKRGRPPKSGHRDRISRPANSVERVAQMTGQSPREVRRKAKIGREGTPKLREALAEGRVGLVVAEQLAGLDHRSQDRQLHLILRPRRGERPVIVPEVQKALDSLDHAARALTAFSKSRFPPETVAEFRKRHAAVGAALERFGGKSRSSPSADSSERPDPALTVKLEEKAYNTKLCNVAYSPHSIRPRPHPAAPYVATTTVSMAATCPLSCAFKGTPTKPGGCYVTSGYTQIGLVKLDRAAVGLTAEQVIAAEVRAIDDAFGGDRVPQDGARGGRDLRLHVGGDVGSVEGAKMLAKAARRWRCRGGGSVWTYTHYWREIPRSAWGDAISVLASVENPKQTEEARRRGYASVVVVPDFANGDRAYSLPGTKAKIVPCPAETRDATCAECRLCLERDLLAMNVAVAFRVHGQHERAARAALARACGRC